MAGITATVILAAPMSFLGAATAHSVTAQATSVATTASTLTIRVTPGRVVVDRSRPIVEVAVLRADQVTANDGTVTLSEGVTVLATAPVAEGRALLQLPVYDSVGTRTLTASYAGGTSADAVSDFPVVVDKATARISPANVTLTESKRARFTVFVPAEGLRARGEIKVKLKGQSKWVTLALRDGRAVVKMQALVKGSRTWSVGPRQRKVIVRYLGNATTHADRKGIRVSVEGR
jgi:hypothetical protein